jgi:hypothetical protein
MVGVCVGHDPPGSTLSIDGRSCEVHSGPRVPRSELLDHARSFRVKNVLQRGDYD